VIYMGFKVNPKYKRFKIVVSYLEERI